MRLTYEHGAAFGYFKTPPKMRELCKLRAPNLHRLINQHAGIKDSEIGVNALHLLSLRLRNGTPIREALTPSKWDAVNIPKRWHAFNRWKRAYDKAATR